MRDAGKTTAREALNQKVGRVRQEFPGEFLDKTLDEIRALAKSGNAKARKAAQLLFDRRFDKRDL
jgi:hypothetical protein